MRYWWVNQNQTYRQEIGGGYLWSPKRKTNDHRNAFYEFMREVAPGDVIFSFVYTRIVAIGIAASYCYESPKPTEFGAVGANWNAIGWRIDVRFRELRNRVRPKDHIAHLRAHLPKKYSPLMPNGDGLQSVYLAALGLDFARVLGQLIGTELNEVRDIASNDAQKRNDYSAPEQQIVEWERRVEEVIQHDRSLAETEKLALVQARVGQGLFRSRVQTVETCCRLTKVDKPEHLIASHTKPWRDSNNEERLDPENGLLLTPTMDHLFDKGFISFEDGGNLIISPVAHLDSLKRMGVPTDQGHNVGPFSQGQKKFLDYHRDNILRMSHLTAARAKNKNVRSAREPIRSFRTI